MVVVIELGFSCLCVSASWLSFGKGPINDIVVSPGKREGEGRTVKRGRFKTKLGLINTLSFSSPRHRFPDLGLKERIRDLFRTKSLLRKTCSQSQRDIQSSAAQQVSQSASIAASCSRLSYVAVKSSTLLTTLYRFLCPVSLPVGARGNS